MAPLEEVLTLRTSVPPDWQIAPATLPPLILTSEPGSFAHRTLRDRVPAILRETIALNDFPPDIRGELETLHAELMAGAIRELREETPDAAFWQAVSAPYIGRTWLDVPWYWAEAFFYRRVLEATRYFQPGPWQGFDPFATKKRQEWAPEAAPAAVARLLEDLPDDADARFERLLHASLWGNRTDLSYTVAAHLGATAGPGHERSNLLVDDTVAIWQHLQLNAGGRVAILADNAGTELLMDIALIDFLLTTGLAGEVHLHLKPQPFFVSDAMIRDLADGTDALAAAGDQAAQKLARRVDGHIVAGELILKTHWFNASSLFYCQLPDDLAADLAGMDLVLVKGDANYRRLLGDAHWPPAMPFADAVAYFPAPVAALRTLKGEIIVGLAPGRAEGLAGEDPAWLVNGQRGVIQARI
jgi:uncharacterized protein with ATP-grasp and redox domains